MLIQEANYATGRKPLATMTDDDFPLAIFIQPALDAIGIDLDSNYTGSSKNPFITEVFNQAVRSNRLEAFSTIKVELSSAKSYGERKAEAIAARFSIDAQTIISYSSRMRAYFPNLNPEDRMYYAAVINMIVADKPDTRKFPTFLNFLRFSKTGSAFPLYSGERISTVYEINDMFNEYLAPTVINQTNDFLIPSLCLNFSKAECQRLLQEKLGYEGFKNAVGLKTKMGVSDVEEIVENIHSVPESYLTAMLAE